LPKVAASYTAITTNNPLMAFGSKLNQAILTQQDFNPALLNNPDNVQNFATEISIMQPLLNLDGVHGRTAAKIQLEAYQLQTERTKEYLELEAAKLYMQLQLTYAAVEVLAKAQKTANEAVKLVGDYYEQGMVQKSDLLDAQVRANDVKNQLQFAQSNVQNTSDQLSILIGTPAGTTTFRPQDKSSIEYELSVYASSISESRKDIIAMTKSVDGYNSMLKSSKMAFAPRINAFGSVQVYDNSAFGFSASGYLVGAKLSWDIFNGYANVAKVNKAKLQKEKSEIELEQYTVQQQAELSKTTRMLIDSKNKIALSELAFQQSSESHKIRKDRFEQGLEKVVDLLVSESQMYGKELQLMQAIFEYNVAKEYLHFLTR
jgi:outer membrane protein TolC